ncbi:MAG: hypothetical protein GTO03_13330 [Planctomycetales bacterium]|nr:hypothetical protein [Planctomycetales bacterium]
MTATSEDYRWLFSPEGARYLAQPDADPADPLKVLDALRRELTPQRAALVVEQLQLRHRAARKFADAPRMFFTRRGLEQASGEVVALHKATRFTDATRVLDLCCGIGGDLLALAMPVQPGPDAREVVGIDCDPIAALCAAANLEAGGRSARVEVGDAADVDVTACEAWHIDPDRRAAGRRTTGLVHFHPPLAALDRGIQRNGQAAVKLAPATVPPAHWCAAAELEWISWQNECRQQVAWFGTLATSAGEDCRGRRRATWLSREGDRCRSIVGQADLPLEVASQPARYVFDLDPSVRAARLTGAVAAKFQLAALGPGGAYLTGAQPGGEGLLSCFQVSEVLPFDRRRLARLLAARQIGHLEIKKRGIPAEVATEAARLRPAGSHQATLLLTRLAGRVTAILAQRIREGSPPSGGG